jgi:hypothetical protein
MIGEISGVEMKCPRIETHLGYLLSNSLPKQYVAQVQFSMYVTGFHEWQFMSYRRNFPPMIITVGRDDKFHGAIEEALESFFHRFDASMKMLIEINGGPPDPRTRGVVPFRQPSTPTTETNDVIP